MSKIAACLRQLSKVQLVTNPSLHPGRLRNDRQPQCGLPGPMARCSRYSGDYPARLNPLSRTTGDRGVNAAVSILRSEP